MFWIVVMFVLIPDNSRSKPVFISVSSPMLDEIPLIVELIEASWAFIDAISWEERASSLLLMSAMSSP